MEAVLETPAPETPHDQYVDVKEVAARFWTAGSTGSPVLLIHGLGRYVEDWLSSVVALSGEHRVYALDLIGHGRTDKPPHASYGLDALVQFVRDFMISTGIERAHVVGHSLGGAIATRLALTYPEVVERLVLVDPAGLSPEVHTVFRLMRRPLVGELFTRPSRSGSARMLRLCVYDQSLVTDEMIEPIYQMSSLPGAQKALLKTVRECGKSMLDQGKSGRPDIRRLATFPNPVLVVWGRQDKLVPVTHAEIAAKEVPRAIIRLFDRCGHAPMWEHPEEFNALLLDFLRD